ncbi:hypothetical protein LINGRAHAP2_LOCUS19979 [Linum grandiflorum]
MKKRKKKEARREVHEEENKGYEKEKRKGVVCWGLSFLSKVFVQPE